MSLINRMLSDLAARQAPGSEAMDGVHLAQPLEQADRSVSRRAVLITLSIAVLVLILAWKFWPRPGVPAPPQLRMAQDLGASASAGPSAPEAAPVGSPGIPGATDPAQADAVAVEATSPMASAPRNPRLRLATDIQVPRNLSVATLRAAEQPLARRRDPVTDKPVTRPRPEPADAAAGTQSARQTPRTRQEPVPRAEPTPPAPAAAPPAKPTPADRAGEARAWLAAGNALAAVESLGPANAAESAEITSLRAAALQRLQRHDEAAREYGRLTVSQPDQPGHWVGLGISLEATGQSEAAGLAYRRALGSPQLSAPLRQFARDRARALGSP